EQLLDAFDDIAADAVENGNFALLERLAPISQRSGNGVEIELLVEADGSRSFQTECGIANHAIVDRDDLLMNGERTRRLSIQFLVWLRHRLCRIMDDGDVSEVSIHHLKLPISRERFDRRARSALADTGNARLQIHLTD